MNTTAGVSGTKIPCVSKHPQKLIDTSIGTLLEFIPARICRILFDNNCIDYRSAISDSELTKLYNIRARQFGVSLISERNLSASLCSKACWRIMTVGKTERSGLRTAFSRNGGKANTRRQARTNIRRWTAKDISDILDFAEEILSENGWSMANSDLVKELQKLYPELNYATCSQNLTRSNRFDIMQRSGNLSSIITVKGHRHIVPESFRDTIRKCAVQDIALSKDNAIGRGDLYDKYIGHVPADQNANAALSKIFGDADTFVKTRDANGNVLLSLTPRALYHAKHSMNEACRN